MKMRKQFVSVGRLVLKTDEKAFKALKPYERTWPFRAISFVGELGDQPPLRTASGAMATVGLLSRNRRLIRAAIRMGIAHELATFAKNTIKRHVDRHRPKKARKRDDRKIRNGHRTDKALTSFPSGHSAGAIAVAQAFSRDYPEHRSKAIGAATAVAAAQVPKSMHYVTDVLVGLAIGVFAEFLTNQAWNALEGRMTEAAHH